MVVAAAQQFRRLVFFYKPLIRTNLLFKPYSNSTFIRISHLIFNYKQITINRFIFNVYGKRERKKLNIVECSKMSNV